ncbi:MAG TPA: hypothetical protein PLR18_02915 [bacterium]|nr:hypothetical protein [bacterium]
MEYKTLQAQYDKIYSYFKTTTEPFDFLDWDGKLLMVWLNDSIVEKYTLKELAEIISLL